MNPSCSCYGTADGVDYWVTGYYNGDVHVYRYNKQIDDYQTLHVYKFTDPIVACLFAPNAPLFVCTAKCIYEWLSIERQVVRDCLLYTSDAADDM
jgi:hypothetical protein